MKLHSIDTGLFKLDGGAMFGVVPKSIWSKFKQSDANNMVNWAMRCLLIESGKKLILIDCGIGDKQDEKFFSHYYLNGDGSLQKSLHTLGFGFDEITDVILTHLHFDHCGGAVHKKSDGSLVPAFPNAVYWLHEDHWNLALNPNQREKASFLKENFVPIQENGQLQFLKADTVILPEISYLFVDGHTEKMTIPLIRYKGKTVAYMADLLPSPYHMPIPFVMAYDVRPLLTMDEKASFLNEAFDKQYVLFFEHDHEIEACNLRNQNGRITMHESIKLSDLS